MDSLIRTIHGVRAIRLQGTREERAIQHGKIIAALKPGEASQLALNPLSKKNQFLIAKTAKKIKGIGTVLSKFYEAFVLERLIELPAKYKNRLKPFAKASKIPERTLWLALYQPDLLMVLASIANDRVRNQFLQGMPGCSTGVYCTDDSMLFLRNLDYPAAAHWEKFPTAFYHEPTEPGFQNFVSISSLGIHTPGLTGFNESGIAFSLHAQFSKKVSLKGAPIFFLGEDILERARTLEDAIQLCREFKAIGSWTLNLASFKEKKAASVELSEGKIHVRTLQTSPWGEFIAHANGFQSPVFQKNELHFNGSFFEDVVSRKCTLEKAHPKTVVEALNALSSHVDFETGETRIFGNTVSVVTTIQSTVIDPSNQCFYLSNRNETPTPLGPFVKLPFRWEDLSRETNPEQRLAEPSTVHSPEFLSALHAYHEAYVAWQVVRGPNSGKSDLTHAYLLEATETLPTDPHLWVQRGYFEMMHGEYKTALDCFDRALGLKMSLHHCMVATYFKAACLDLLGERANAVRHYGEVLSHEKLDSKLRKRAQNRLEKPFQRAYCQKIEPDLQFVEPLQYI